MEIKKRLSIREKELIKTLHKTTVYTYETILKVYYICDSLRNTASFLNLAYRKNVDPVELAENFNRKNKKDL